MEKEENNTNSVNFSKIMSLLKKALTKDQKSLESIEKRLRNEKNINQIYWSGLRVMISRNLPEQPINILIP